MTVSDYQISIGGLTLGNGLPYIVHSIDGFGMPDVRVNDTARPRDHGEFYGLDYMGGRTVTISLTIRASSDSAVIAAHDALMAVWQPVDDTTAAISPLAYKFPGQVERHLNGRPRRSTSDLSRVVSGTITCVLEYHTADPRQYAVASTPSLGLSVASAGRTYPRTYPLSFGAGTSATINAVNSGNFPTRPLARILGPVTNPKIENITAGLFVKLMLSLSSTDYVDLDFDAKTIVLNGTASRYSTLTTDSRWWELAPGTSSVRFSSDSFDPAALLTLTLSSAWI